MADNRLIDERFRRAARLRFAPDVEPRFRAVLRGRQRIPRTLLFLVFALSFGLAPFYSHALFQPNDAAAPFMLVIDWAVVTPVTLLAAALTLFPSPPLLRQGAQSAAVVVLLMAVMGYRALALQGALQYSPLMIGIVLLAIAFFGGFSWWRVAPLSAAVAVAAAAMEFHWAAPGAHPGLQSYGLFFMAVIAILGSYNLEFLARLVWWDYTQLRSVESALRISEHRFKGFMDHTPMTAWIKDADGRYVYRNKTHRDVYSEGADDWVGRSDLELFPAEDARSYMQTDGDVLKTGKVIEFDVENRDSRGRLRDWWVHKFPIRDEQGRMAVAGVGMDVSERKRLQRELFESESRFQAFLDHNPGLSWMKDGYGRYRFASASYLQAVGQDDVRGKTDAELFDDVTASTLREIEERVLRTHSTEVVEGLSLGGKASDRYWMLVVFPFMDSEWRDFTGWIATDITERKRAEDLARLQSLSDELTGLYNRRGLNLLAEQELRGARRAQQGCALLCVDLDGLKQINDEHGHAAGDRAIVALAEVLRLATRASDVVARTGGDEFVVFAVGADPEPMRQRVLERLEALNAQGQLPFRLAASAGFVSFEPGATAPLDDMLAMADAEMYRIKRGRRRSESAAA